MIVNGNHGLEPSGSVVILHDTHFGRPRLLDGHCERNFGIICNDRGVDSKLKGRGGRGGWSDAARL